MTVPHIFAIRPLQTSMNKDQAAAEYVAIKTAIELSKSLAHAYAIKHHSDECGCCAYYAHEVHPTFYNRLQVLKAIIDGR